MITYDDDNVMFLFLNGETHIYRRTKRTRPFERTRVFEPIDPNAWLRRIDDAMFANYYDPCMDG